MYLLHSRLILQNTYIIVTFTHTQINFRLDLSDRGLGE